MQGGGKMAEALLVNRTRFTSSLKNEHEAIEDLLKKYEKRVAE